MLIALLLSGVISEAVALLPPLMQEQLLVIKIEVVMEIPAMRLGNRRSTVTEAWIKPGDLTIYISDWSDTYKKSKKGNQKALMRLASDIAHELYHLRNGLSEAPAYDEQIRVLSAMGAPRDLIADVRRSKDFVLSFQH